MRESFRDRQQLLPYRYSAAAVAHETGLCAHRGMHFDFPAESDAYTTSQQYMLGPDLIVAPATAPVSPPIPEAGGGQDNGTVTVALWVPPGDWVDFFEPTLAFSTGWTNVDATIYQVPVLARAGSIIPLLPRNTTSIWGISARQYDALVFRRMPGGGDAHVQVYEDDGISTDYLQGIAASTDVSVVAGGGPGCDMWSIKTSGNYTGMVAVRSFTIEAGYGASPPNSVVQDGVALAQSATDGEAGTWFAAADHFAVYLHVVDSTKGTLATICQE
jgi:alpha-glucosidase (family GH31 glycosyl hydrolase)